MKITTPGIYTDISEADYRNDPCPIPSLTQSLAKILLEQSPLHAWHANPRMNPDYMRNDDTKYDVGNISHKLLLGRGRELVVLDFDDWRTGAAKEARKEATAAGKLAVLAKHVGKAERMVTAAREQLEQRGLGHLFQADGASEACVAWQEGDIWLRQLVDWLSPDRLTFVDFKSTDMSVAPHLLGRQMVTAGWPIQAAMGERGLDMLDTDNAGRRRYLFVVQETEKPYCLNVVEVTEGPLTLGRKLLGMAAVQWRACLKDDRWPGYPAEIITPEMPGWFETQVLEREIEWSEHPKYRATVEKIRAARGAERDGENLRAG